MPIISIGRAVNGNKSLILPQALAQELNLKELEKIEVRFGSLSAMATVKFIKHNDNQPRALLSHDLANALYLHSNLHLRIKRENDVIRFGPIIGIFVSRTRSITQPFLSQTPYFRGLVRMGRAHALPTFVFTSRDVNWEKKIVRAWVIRKRAWVRVNLPLPDVIYDRVQTRKLDYLPSVRKTKKQIQEANIPMFNTGFLDKWNTFRLLNETEAQTYLPHTKLVEKKEDIYQFARQFSTIYVKPVGGSLGQGIMVLWRSGRRYHLLHYGINRASTLRNLKSPAPLWARIQHRMKRRNYVVQQGLRLVRYRGRKFDFRLLMQKEGNEWKISLFYARIAPVGSLRANLEAGGDAKRSMRVLRSCFGKRARLVLNRITEAGVLISQALEKESSGPIGELGLDIGVDRRGKPWLIEANAKPLRRMVGPRKRLYTSLRRPLYYAKDLAGF